jgi:hypothetical protein
MGNVSENNIIPHHPNSPTHSNYDFHVKRQPQLNLDAFEDGINIIRTGNNNIETIPAGHSKWAMEKQMGQIFFHILGTKDTIIVLKMHVSSF